MRRCLALLAVALITAAAPLMGQVQVTGIRDLNFGAVIPGLQTSVSPADPIRSGQFYVRYVAGGRVRLRFTLPSSLTRVGGGATMPIRFRNGDGIFQETDPGSPPSSINPNAASTEFLLLPNPDANIWIGGSVTPSTTQASGTYVGTIVLSVTVF
jgi:hypothetical protein